MVSMVDFRPEDSGIFRRVRLAEGNGLGQRVGMKRK